MDEHREESGGTGGYTSIPTSAHLKTQPIGQSPAHTLEHLDKATPFGRRVGGQWLAQTHIRSAYVPVLLDVYDRLALDQTAEEQAVFGHLYRLALADERNFCRVSRRDLSLRTKLSDRRLGKALAGLVEHGHIALVERDRSGTLYRVFLPHEVFKEATPDSVLAVRETKVPASPAVHSSAPTQAPKKTKEKRANETSQAQPVTNEAPQLETSSKAVDYNRVSKTRSIEPPTTLGQVAAAFSAQTDGRYVRSEIVEEILGRMEEGRTLPEIAEELAAFAAEAPKKTPLRDLSRFLERRR